MRRWGYITIDGTAGKVHNRRPSPGAVLGATAAGLRAREIWRPLPALIEQRWRERFGADQLSGLRDPLTSMVSRLDPGLPDCLPILGAALLSPGPDPRLPPRPDGAAPEAMPLSALLSRVLLSFAVEYEREAGLSLAVAANMLRVLGTEGTRLRHLPALTGTSKESVRWALGILTRGDLAAEDPDPAASRGKVARLTPRGPRCAAPLPRAHRRDRAALARPVRPGRDRRPPGLARTAGRRPAAAPVRRARAVSGQLARLGPPPGRLAALPHGSAPRRLSGRQLTPLARS
jgi:hypothetical protein